MRSWLSLGVLLVAVVALGTWVYLKPPPRGPEPHALSALAPAHVKRVRVERFDGTAPIVLERREAGWRLTSPFSARADRFQVERLLSIVEARSGVRYPAADLARFGLDKPVAALTLEDQSFAYGTSNTMTREQYVLTNGSVFAVPLAYATALPRESEALIARELLAPGEIAVRFELPDFTVRLQDGGWKLEGAPAEASADERHAWADAWQLATAIRAARSAASPSSPAIRITLKTGNVVPLDIVRREPELVLLRADEGIEYHFFAENAKRLLAPPGAATKPPVR